MLNNHLHHQIQARYRELHPLLNRNLSTRSFSDDPEGETRPCRMVNTAVCLVIPELATPLCKQLEAASSAIMFARHTSCYDNSPAVIFALESHLTSTQPVRTTL